MSENATGVEDLGAALKLMRNIAATVHLPNEAESVIEQCLAYLCQHFGWTCAVAYLPGAEGCEDLRPVVEWIGPAAPPRSFATYGKAQDPSRSSPISNRIAGRVLASGRPEFVSDLPAAYDAFFVEQLQSLHLQSAAIFPLQLGDRTLGVWEFFSQQHIATSAHLLDLMHTAGHQLASALERKRAAHELQAAVRAAGDLHESRERLGLALAASELGLWDADLRTGQLTVDERWAAMLEYSLDEVKPHITVWESLIHPDDVSRFSLARSRHLDRKEASFLVDHRLRTKSGNWKWIRSRGRVTERDDDGRPIRMTGTHRDITERKRLEREVVETAAEEQRRIGQELHDGVGSELTAIGFTLQGLIHDLQESHPSAADVAAKIGDGIDRVTAEVRLLSHGLDPVEVDHHGLFVALGKLAERTSQLYQLPCEFNADDSVVFGDRFVADHLYRIAQEAVTNAAKHADPQRIVVTLQRHGNSLLLQVDDDGVGVHDDQHVSDGIGLRNMHYRARLIGADLQIKTGETGGVVVSCRFTSDRIG